MNEFSFIEYLKKKAQTGGHVLLGIGDDAAVLEIAKGKHLVVSTDVIVEGVDFILKKLSPEKIGRKALAVNLSDFAAMGAKPVAFVITIGKPKYISTVWLSRFYSGLLKLAKSYGVACVGGDFSAAKEFFASVTILGEVSPNQAVTRAGAAAGDWIAVTGSLGGSRLRKHYDFTPRVAEGLFLTKHITPTAMIDISDGFCQDLGHILKASKVGACLELDKIPVSADAYRDRSGNTKQTCPFGVALERALSDGEDFELLFTVPPWQKMMLEKSWKKHFPKVPLTWVGKIEGKKSVIHWRCRGKVVAAPKLSQKGFSHF